MCHTAHFHDLIREKATVINEFWTTLVFCNMFFFFSRLPHRSILNTYVTCIFPEL